MTDMWRNEYGAPAGKGARARKRLRIEDVNANTMNVKPPRKKDTRKRYERKPEMEKARAKKLKASESYYSVAGIKAKVRMLVIDKDVSYLDLMDILKREGMPLSGVTASNLRSEMKDIMKMLEREGLLNIEALARRRKKIKAGDRV